MDKTRQFKELAGDFLSRFQPEVLKQVDSLFEQLKTDYSSKLEANFGLAMPPEMRRKILSDIGLNSDRPDTASERYVPYLKILEKIIDCSGDNPGSLSQNDIADLICREGKKLKLFDYEIQRLLDIVPSWYSTIVKKCVVEISPASLCQVNSGNKESENETDTGEISFSGIIGRSETMRSMFTCLKRISASNLSILIQGESGTGKELVAHAIHSLSNRAAHGFIPVNCGALPDSIIESELFGYEKGAFTGADFQKKGYFEISDQGTIFLDEITETSLNTQVKLLRVLQEKQFYRVGGTRAVQANCRIIAATNRDVLEMAKTGTFRQDLYYRINEMTISLPPLRERKDDLPLLVKHFLKNFSLQNNRKEPDLSDSAWNKIQQYNWPGNIRELENVLKRAVVLADDEIRPEHFPQVMLNSEIAENCECIFSNETGSLEKLLEQAERSILISQLKKNAGNVSKTAESLQISRRTLQRKMKHLGIDRSL